MSVSVTMPPLGESGSQGTVTRWLKQQGDQVQADEPLLEVSTDKVDTEIPSPASGVLTAIRVCEGETVPVGVELAVIQASQGGAGVGAASDRQPHGRASAAARDAQSAAAAVPPVPARQRQPQRQAGVPWHGWALLVVAVIFIGDAVLGQSQPTWERIAKGVLAGGIFVGELVALPWRRGGRT